MIEVTNEDIANTIFEAICFHSLDKKIRNNILEKFEDNEVLHEQICGIFDDVARAYFIEGYLLAKK